MTPQRVTPMVERKQGLVWIDLEMTGLDPDRDRIIEIATIITDRQLETLAIGPVLAIHQGEASLCAMDEWNRATHKQTGLIERVRTSTISESEAERATLDFIKGHVAPNSSPLCCNSICQDRRFLYRHMPELEQYLHYRHLDVSTLKELASFWRPELLEGFKKRSKHRALEDIQESIEELRYYRTHFINDQPAE